MRESVRDAEMGGRKPANKEAKGELLVIPSDWIPVKRMRFGKYEPEMCEIADSFLAEGYSLTGLAGQLGIGLTTLSRWRKENPEFEAAVDTGLAAGARYWETELIRICRTGKGNVAAAIFGVKNRSRAEWSENLDNQKEHVTIHINGRDAKL